MNGMSAPQAGACVMVQARLPDGTMIWVPQPGQQQAGVGAAGTVSGPGGTTTGATGNGQPHLVGEGTGGSSSGGGGRTQAQKREDRLMNAEEKLDLDGYRDLLIHLNPEGPTQESISDELREAGDAPTLNSVMAKKAKREVLLNLVLSAGAELSEYERTRLTRGQLMQRLQDKRHE